MLHLHTMQIQQKKTLRETADHLRRLAEQLRNKSGAMTPESRLAIAGSYALLALAFQDEEKGDDAIPRKNWTLEMCKHALDSIEGKVDKPLDFQN